MIYEEIMNLDRVGGEAEIKFYLGKFFKNLLTIQKLSCYNMRQMVKS